MYVHCTDNAAEVAYAGSNGRNMRVLFHTVASDSLVCLQNYKSPVGCVIFNTHMTCSARFLTPAWVKGENGTIFPFNKRENIMCMGSEM